MTAYMNGWHIDRLSFDQMLAQAAVKAGTRLYLGTRVDGCRSIGEEGFALNIVNSEGVHELRAKFLVDASGRHPCMAGWLGAHRAIFDRLVGVAVQFCDDNALSNCYTLVETTTDGWWYSAPVCHNRSVAILMTDGDIIRSNNMDLLTNWQKALQRAKLTDARIKGCNLCWGPRVFSAVSQRLMKDPADSKPWLAVGDAALSVDPITGSGVIRALRMANEAAMAALAVLNGDPEAMAKYEAQRNAECTKYLIERLMYYGMEERWLESTFWKRRDIAHKQLMNRPLHL
jgi:flavin-dependent dehydrogenase